jgi:hypothetical protein
MGCHHRGGHLAQPVGGYGESGEVVAERMIIPKLFVFLHPYELLSN